MELEIEIKERMWEDVTAELAQQDDEMVNPPPPPAKRSRPLGRLLLDTETYNVDLKNKGRHIDVWPLLAVVLSVLYVGWPFDITPNWSDAQQRRGLFQSIATVLRAPFSPHTFVFNFVADILCSLSLAFQDIWCASNEPLTRPPHDTTWHPFVRPWRPKCIGRRHLQ
jgi:hypothetical protein